MARIGAAKPDVVRQARRTLGSAFDYARYGLVQGAEGLAYGSYMGAVNGVPGLASILGATPGYSTRSLTYALEFTDRLFPNATRLVTGNLQSRGGVVTYGQQPVPSLGSAFNTRSLNLSSTGPASSGLASVLAGLMSYLPSSSLGVPAAVGSGVQQIVAPWQGTPPFQQAASPPSNAAQIAERHTSLAQQQVSAHYTDPAVQSLMAEGNRTVDYVQARDPVLVYLENELAGLMQRVENELAAARAVRSAAGQIAERTVPATTPQQGSADFDQRLALYRSMTEAENQALQYINPQPDLVARIRQLTQQIAQRRGVVLGASDVTRWFADWRSRTEDAMAKSPGFEAVGRGLDRLLSESPDFQRYLTLRREVAALVDRFADHQLAVRVRELTSATLADPAVSDAMLRAYTAYQSRLTDPELKSEIERYLVSLNGIVKNDPLFSLMDGVQSAIVGMVDGHRGEVHKLVQECVRGAGASCDPLADPRIRSLTTGERATALAGVMGEFRTIHDRYWHLFFTSAAFQSIETESARRLRQVLDRSRPSLADAQTRLTTELFQIPKLTALRAAYKDLIDQLRRESPDLNRKLNEVEQLESQLSGGATGRPDLVVTAFKAPRIAGAGKRTGRLEVTVRNEGTSAAGPFRVDFYFSRDPEITTSDIYSGWACTVTGGLAAGEVYNCSGPIEVPAGLAHGTYWFGAIADTENTVAESNETNNVRPNEIGAVTVGRHAQPVLLSLNNAARTWPGAFTPGQILILYGELMREGSVAPAPVSGAFGTEAAGTRVWFDDVAAPILYASPGQINLVSPLALAGKTGVRVTVEFNGVRSDPLFVPIQPVNTGFYPLSPRDQPLGGPVLDAILNQDGSLNSPQNKAAIGSVVIFYATGSGPTEPAGRDGMLAPLTAPLEQLTQTVWVMVQGQPATVLFAGSAPGLVHGLQQFNVKLPATVRGFGGSICSNIQFGVGSSVAQAACLFIAME